MKKLATPAKYVLRFNSKWMFQDVPNCQSLYSTMENWARDLRAMEKLGIQPMSPIEGGQTEFETNDPKVAKRFGFEKRTREELRELGMLPPFV